MPVVLNSRNILMLSTQILIFLKTDRKHFTPDPQGITLFEE